MVYFLSVLAVFSLHGAFHLLLSSWGLRSKRTINNALAVKKTGKAQEIADKLSGMESLDHYKFREAETINWTQI